MGVDVRVIGTDGVEIQDLDGWFEHAPPAGGIDQWVDCYSAKEQAKAWLRPGHPEVPDEIATAVEDAGFGKLDMWTAYPEHQTKLDKYGRGPRGRRHHDMLVLLGHPDAPAAVLGIEAKACEDFDGQVGDRASIPLPNKRLERCNLMAEALFGRPVFDLASRTSVDEQLAAHGYQLWTGSVGTLREAQAHGAVDALFLIHQFEPGSEPCSPKDTRPWEEKLKRNERSIASFRSTLGPQPATSHQTEFIDAGRRLHLLSIRSVMSATP